MIYPALVTIAALLVYLWIIAGVGRARFRHRILPPVVTGPEDFERAIRAQQNTVEQLVIFLPALWLCAQFLSPVIAAWIGALWVVARIFYALGYWKSNRRYPAFGVNILSSIALLLGALWGIIVRLTA
jgi:glutathione S-transferase